MRLFLDEHNLDWDTAWSISEKTLCYTNHTLLPEALERWSVKLFKRLLPRHLELIYEINFRFLEDVRTWFPGDDELAGRLSIIEEGPEKQVRMAHLAASELMPLTGWPPCIRNCSKVRPCETLPVSGRKNSSTKPMG